MITYSMIKEAKRRGSKKKSRGGVQEARTKIRVRCELIRKLRHGVSYQACNRYF